MFLLERETLQNVQWTFALQRPKRSGDCRTSCGRSLCNDRSEAETSNLRVPAGLENTKKMVSNRIPSFCVSFRARDGTRTRGLDLGKVALHQLSHSRIFVRIGVTGFEPATSWSQTRRSSQAEPHPESIVFHYTFKTSYKVQESNVFESRSSRFRFASSR